MAIRKYKAYCPRCKARTTGKTICWDCTTKKYNEKQTQERVGIMSGRLDIELQAAGAKALDIPNPENKKTVMVQCVTAQKAKETLSELHKEILKATQDPSNLDMMVQIHEAFTKANKEMQLNNKENK